MKLIHHLSLVLLLWLIFPVEMSAANYKSKAEDSLSGIFKTPGDSVQTSVYWYWISGYISEDGVRKDLEAMKRAGINRAFIGNVYLDGYKAPYKPVELFSDEWRTILHAALKKASELGIEIGIFNCPGWSQAGGPWVAPGQSMRYLANVKAEFEGGKDVAVALPAPSDDFQDVKVLAFPMITEDMPPLTTEATGIKGDASAATDGDDSTEVMFDASGRAVFTLTAPRDITLRSLEIKPAFRHIRAEAVLEVREGDVFRKICEFPIDRTNPNVEVGWEPYAPVVVSIPATTGREFRLTFTGAAEDSGLKEIVVSSRPRVERYAEKTLAKMYQTPLPYWNEYQWREQPEAGDAAGAIEPEAVIDVSGFMNGDTLRWHAPEGRWMVMRTGMRPTGITNGPAAPEGTGHEIDKLTDKYLQHHFDSFIGEILRRIPERDRRTFKVIVADSYEKGGQNFSDDFIGEFTRRYGYSPVPYLPVYDGIVVGNRDMSDRFLWDMRRFVADRLAYSHIGGMREIAHKNGLTLWLENYGHWGFPGEFLQYGGQSDEVSGEFWSEGTLGDIENRAASSSAHIYGKKKVSAESYTAAGQDFLRHPAMLKPRGDRFFAEGINNTLLHVYISQPDDRKPGLNAWFGSEFNRNNSWFSHIDLFTDYLKRCNLMLQQGINVADVAYFIGEDAPKMTGVTDPVLPPGFQFDYINGEVIMTRLDVRDGRWTLPDGTSYSVLVLPKLKTMRPELLRRLGALVAKGAVLFGPAPEKSPSLERYPTADTEVSTLARRMWAADGSVHSFGRGYIVEGPDLASAFSLAGLDCDVDVPEGTSVVFCHRNAGKRQIYFLANQSGDTISFPASFRVGKGRPELWLPTDGSRRGLPQYSCDGSRTVVPLTLQPFESVFVVFSDGAEFPANSHGTTNFPAGRTLARLDSWSVELRNPIDDGVAVCSIDSVGSLSDKAEESMRYFSGSADYTTQFSLTPEDIAGGRIIVNTGRVGAMAKVHVNGYYAGGVWTAPYTVDITPFVRSGVNKLRIEVATTWVNRLIGDSRLPENERKSWTLTHPWKPDSPLQPSGLLRPVIIEKIDL